MSYDDFVGVGVEQEQVTLSKAWFRESIENLRRSNARNPEPGCCTFCGHAYADFSMAATEAHLTVCARRRFRAALAATIAAGVAAAPSSQDPVRVSAQSIAIADEIIRLTEVEGG